MYECQQHGRYTKQFTSECPLQPDLLYSETDFLGRQTSVCLTQMCRLCARAYAFVFLCANGAGSREVHNLLLSSLHRSPSISPRAQRKWFHTLPCFELYTFLVEHYLGNSVPFGTQPMTHAVSERHSALMKCICAFILALVACSLSHVLFMSIPERDFIHKLSVFFSPGGQVLKRQQASGN